MKRGVYLAACIVLCASRAQAEPETGSRFDRRPNAVTDSANAPVVPEVVNTFARCVASLRPTWAEQMLGLGLLSAQQMRAIDKEAGGLHTCYQTSQFDLKFNALSFVGGVAEQRISTRFNGAKVTHLAAISDDLLFASAAAPKTTMEDLAVCIARKNPVATRSLIDTRPSSAEEWKLIGKLTPHLGDCIPTGLKIAVNRSTVRAYAAIGLYQLLANETAIMATSTGGN